ncbi:MAG: ornithine cyclodeaminase family protein, partial [Bryobacterales bacterium]|nr:ornithine cyclodeaminase family protein [Bryobacterales bacterium]
MRRLLPMADAVGLMREAFQELRTGEAVNHSRRRIGLPTGSTLHYMAAGDAKYFGTKVYSTHPKYGANFWFLL